MTLPATTILWPKDVVVVDNNFSGWIVGWKQESGVWIVCDVLDKRAFPTVVEATEWHQQVRSHDPPTLLATIHMPQHSTKFPNIPISHNGRPNTKTELILYDRRHTVWDCSKSFDTFERTVLCRLNRAVASPKSKVASITNSRSATTTTSNNNDSCRVSSRWINYLARHSFLVRHLVCSHQSDDSLDARCIAVVDRLLGLLTLAYYSLYHGRASSYYFLFQQYYALHYHWLHRATLWLESFPVGFKLNAQLTREMGREIVRVWTLHAQIITAHVLEEEGGGRYRMQELLLGGLGIVCVLCGASGGVALLLDLFNLFTCHITVFARVTAIVFEREKYLTRALWRLFCGKKYNVLRERTDTMEYDSMQLLLGTLVFAIVLFLFTTILVYHAFFMCLFIAASAMGVPFVILYVLLNHFPYGTLIMRARYPGRFTNDVYLQEEKGSKELYLQAHRIGYGTLVTNALLPTLRELLARLFSMPKG